MPLAGTATAAPGSEWFGHPRGLAVLFFTEMWERFSFYGMRALLILYMVAPVAQGGLGYPTVKAAAIYGWYTMLVYAAAIPGGLLADRRLGQFRAVLLGGIVIAAGHFSMAVPSVATFFVGLGLIVCGTGLLKPNVSTLVGALYPADDPRRDSGFSIFYMGINVGAMVAPLVCGWLGQRVSWHLGFAAAGFGMLFGLGQYLLGRKWLATARRVAGDEPGIGGTWGGTEGSTEGATEIGAPRPSPSGFTRLEWARLGTIGILFAFAILFWGAFEQAGSSLTLFADRYTRLEVFGRSFPSSWFQVEEPLFVLLLAPAFAWLWVRLGRRQPSSPLKFALGLLLVGAGFLWIVPAAAAAQYAEQGERVSPGWLTGLYLIHTFGELCLSPVGLSLVTKLAPRRIMGLMMGFWFLATAFGNKLAGWAAGWFDRIPVAHLFFAVFAVTAAAGLLLVLLAKPIARLTAVPATAVE